MENGPSRLRWDKRPLQIGDHAPDFELLDSNGRKVSLKSFWSETPTLLIFWRHY
ncbi:MAG: redoxin domain-containing protein [Kangiellaceae bacterium]|nr:redoxin domain-containing protein [Kangiellaceae bacterium]